LVVGVCAVRICVALALAGQVTGTGAVRLLVTYLRCGRSARCDADIELKETRAMASAALIVPRPWSTVTATSFGLVSSESLLRSHDHERSGIRPLDRQHEDGQRLQPGKSDVISDAEIAASVCARARSCATRVYVGRGQLGQLAEWRAAFFWFIAASGDQARARPAF
jgi:hypothetical protein